METGQNQKIECVSGGKNPYNHPNRKGSGQEFNCYQHYLNNVYNRTIGVLAQN